MHGLIRAQHTSDLIVSLFENADIFLPRDAESLPLSLSLSNSPLKASLKILFTAAW